MLPIANAAPPLVEAFPKGAADAEVAPSRVHVHIARWAMVIAGAAVVVAASIQAVRLVQRPPEVSVVAVQLEDVSRMLAVTGRIEAEQAVFVSPRFSGRITEIVRREGDRVKKGEILARLADASAKSDVLQQEAALSSKEHDLAQARRDLARTSSLVASGAVPSAELEASRLVVSRANDEVKRLSAMLREGRSQLVLLAPFDGTIVRRDGELGQVVGPTSTVFEIATVDAARVSAEVDERYVRALRTGMRAEILPLGTVDSKVSASVSYVAQAVDPQTGAATVRFAYDHYPKEILVGMSVDVNVSVETIRTALTVPREAVGGGVDHPFVLVVTDGRIVRRAVTIDDWPAPLVVVRSGLKQGELALVDPKGAAVGARVRTKVTSDGL